MRSSSDGNFLVLLLLVLALVMSIDPPHRSSIPGRYHPDIDHTLKLAFRIKCIHIACLFVMLSCLYELGINPTRHVIFKSQKKPRIPLIVCSTIVNITINRHLLYYDTFLQNLIRFPTRCSINRSASG